MKANSLIWILAMLAIFAWQPAVAQDETNDEPDTREEEREERAEEAGLDLSENQYGGYPAEPRIVGGPTDVSADLATSFPKKNAVTGGIPLSRFFKWKQDLYDRTGIKLSFSYQAVYQTTSDVTGGFPLPIEPEEDWTAAGFLLVEGKWDMLNKGKDWQGGITAALDWRHEFGQLEPAIFQVATGSLWPTEFVYVAWDPWFSQLYWEQWGKKDRFVARVGTQTALQTIDFMRFKDGRTAFSNAQISIPATTMPWPAPGFGAMFEWWPKKGSPLYIIGTMNDVNADPGTISWDNAFEYGQFFYAVEVGAHIGEFPRNFDHYHLTLYYADEKETQVGGSSFFANKAGWGLKLAGEKQWGKIVGFANYSYNTAEGGPFGVTIGEHGINAGVARQMPFGYRGEIAVGATWVQPQKDLETGSPAWQTERNQFGVETYWKLLLTPDLWVTPNVQLIWNPSFNLDKDFIVVAGFKFRWFV